MSAQENNPPLSFEQSRYENLLYPQVERIGSCLDEVLKTDAVEEKWIKIRRENGNRLDAELQALIKKNDHSWDEVQAASDHESQAKAQSASLGSEIFFEKMQETAFQTAVQVVEENLVTERQALKDEGRYLEQVRARIKKYRKPFAKDKWSDFFKKKDRKLKTVLTNIEKIHADNVVVLPRNIKSSEKRIADYKVTILEHQAKIQTLSREKSREDLDVANAGAMREMSVEVDRRLAMERKKLRTEIDKNSVLKHKISVLTQARIETVDRISDATDVLREVYDQCVTNVGVVDRESALYQGMVDKIEAAEASKKLLTDAMK